MGGVRVIKLPQTDGLNRSVHAACRTDLLRQAVMHRLAGGTPRRWLLVWGGLQKALGDLRHSLATVTVLESGGRACWEGLWGGGDESVPHDHITLDIAGHTEGG